MISNLIMKNIKKEIKSEIKDEPGKGNTPLQWDRPLQMDEGLEEVKDNLTVNSLPELKKGEATIDNVMDTLVRIIIALTGNGGEVLLEELPWLTQSFRLAAAWELLRPRTLKAYSLVRQSKPDVARKELEEYFTQSVHLEQVSKRKLV